MRPCPSLRTALSHHPVFPPPPPSTAPCKCTKHLYDPCMAAISLSSDSPSCHDGPCLPSPALRPPLTQQPPWPRTCSPTMPPHFIARYIHASWLGVLASPIVWASLNSATSSTACLSRRHKFCRAVHHRLCEALHGWVGARLTICGDHVAAYDASDSGSFGGVAATNFRVGLRHVPLLLTGEVVMASPTLSRPTHLQTTVVRRWAHYSTFESWLNTIKSKLTKRYISN